MPDHTFRTPSHAATPLAALLLAVLVIAASAAACVSSPTVPREDVRATEQDFVAQATREVLAEEGYDLASDDGHFLQSAWRTAEGERRERIHVRITQTSMGLSLGTRVTIVAPVPDDTPIADDDTSVVVIDGRAWRVDEALAEQARAEESRIGKAIQARWHELRRRNAETAPPPPS